MEKKKEKEQERAVETVDFHKREYYLNRECTWLKFNQRVLRESLSKENPLLERLRFIAITCSNLDEFFMIRVAGLKHLFESGIDHHDISGLTPRGQMETVRVGQCHYCPMGHSHYMENLTDHDVVYLAIVAEHH